MATFLYLLRRPRFPIFLVLTLPPALYFASALSPVSRKAELQHSIQKHRSLTPNQKSTLLFYQQESRSKDVSKGDDGNNGRSIAGITFLSGLVSVVVTAKSGILRGPQNMATGDYSTYADALIYQDVGVTILTSVLGYVLVKLVAFGYEKEVYNNKVSRKLTHTLSAPLFIFCFPLFSAADGARFFAWLVTLTNAVRLYVAGTGGDSSLANSVSRSGDESEALGGPFIYVCLFQLFLLFFWRTSMVGVIAMSTMAAGDGMADLVGRRFGRNNKWWFSESKSVAGSIAFTIASSLASFGLVNWLIFTGCLETTFEPMALALRIIGISVLCAMVELLPVGDDNYTVPLSAAVLTALLLH